MALHTRKDQYGLYTGVRTEEIYRTSRLVSTLTGLKVQANKVVVGTTPLPTKPAFTQDGAEGTHNLRDHEPRHGGLSKSNLSWASIPDVTPFASGWKKWASA